MKKKVISVIMVALMLISAVCISVEPVQASTKKVPAGYTPIYTIEDLYGINDNLSGKYILMNDIDLSETAPGGEWDSGHGWTPIGTRVDDQCFRGVFDGNGYKITNMTIYNDGDLSPAGLFAYFGGKVHSLGLENINITGIRNAGGIAGYMWFGTISDCYVTGSINNEDVNGTAGGITSEMEFDGSIQNCYTDVDIAGGCVGGIVGSLGNDSLAENCYSVGTLESSIEGDIGYTNNIGGIVANTRWSTVRNCYYPSGINYENTNGTKLSKAQMKSEKCYTGFNFKKTWFLDKNSSYPFPQLRSCPQVKITSIELLSAPEKLKYTSGDKLNFEGSELQINYDDGFSNVVELTEEIVSYAMEPGTQTVIVNYYGQTEEFEISVAKAKESLSVTVKKSKLKVGDSYTYKVNYVGTGKVSFKSTNVSVLKINKKTGKAVAKKKGTATIIIKAGSLSRRLKVKVV